MPMVGEPLLVSVRRPWPCFLVAWAGPPLWGLPSWPWAPLSLVPVGFGFGFGLGRSLGAFGLGPWWLGPAPSFRPPLSLSPRWSLLVGRALLLLGGWAFLPLLLCLCSLSPLLLSLCPSSAPSSPCSLHPCPFLTSCCCPFHPTSAPARLSSSLTALVSSMGP